ncbi:MAG: hypothetical protein ACK42I_02860, partial [Thermomicrobium sp.]
MRTHFSRRRFLAMVAAGLGTTLAACAGGQATPTPAPQPTPTAAPAASPTPAAATTPAPAATPTAVAAQGPALTPIPGREVVVWQTVDYLPETTALIKQRLEEVAQKNGFTISFEEIPNNPQGYNRFNAAVQAGTPPDIYRLYDYQTQFWRAQGQTDDVTDLVTPF